MARIVGGEGHALAGLSQALHRLHGAGHGLVPDVDAPVEIEDQLVVATDQGGEGHVASLIPVTRPLALLALSLALAVAGCGGGGKKDNTSTSKTASAPGGCQRVHKPAPKPDGGAHRPVSALNPRKTYDVTLKTSCGDITVRLDLKASPTTSASFVSLARSGFFDNTTFHRIVPGFVIQGRDPTGTGNGSPGYTPGER